jgi:hypothetical protein
MTQTRPVVLVHLFVASFLGRLHCDQHKVVEYLREKHRVLKAQLAVDACS